MKKILKFEIEEGSTYCQHCPFWTITDIDECCGNKNDVFNCCDYDLSTLKVIEYEEDTKV